MDLFTQMPWLIYLLAMLGGSVAGFINTLAGSGSLITLPILIFLGLPAVEANATNRVGILFQSIVGVFKFRRSGNLAWENGQFLVLPTTLGALVGAFIATDLNEQWMNTTIAVVMIGMLGVIIFKPEKWLKEHTELSDNYRGIGNFLLFFVIGLYGGFIQAGVGVFLLMAMVARCGFSMVNANAIKLVLVLIFTIPATLVFIYYDQIDWMLGAIMAVGQGIGAWVGAQYAIGNASAALWTRRLLIAVIIISIVKLLGLMPSF